MKQEIQAKAAEMQELFLNVANVTPHVTEKISEQMVQARTSLWRQCFFCVALLWCAASKRRNDSSDIHVASVTFVGRTRTGYVTDTWPRRLRR